MDKKHADNCYCPYCGCECSGHIVRGENRRAYCSEECVLADRLYQRIIQMISVLWGNND
jgi:hypothetical protein